MKNDVFETAKSALLAVSGNKGENSFLDKFYDHSDHVVIQQKSQQLAGKTTMADSVIFRCQIEKFTKKPRCFLLRKLI